MFTKALLRDIIWKRIETDDELGTYAGGSGHMADISAYIKELESPEETVYDGLKAWKVTYVYVKTITSEFTIYPDNPPLEFVYKQTALISEEGEVIQILGTEGIMDERFMVPFPEPLDEEDGEC